MPSWSHTPSPPPADKIFSTTCGICSGRRNTSTNLRYSCGPVSGSQIFESHWFRPFPDKRFTCDLNKTKPPPLKRSRLLDLLRIFTKHAFPFYYKLNFFDRFFGWTVKYANHCSVNRARTWSGVKNSTWIRAPARELLRILGVRRRPEDSKFNATTWWDEHTNDMSPWMYKSLEGQSNCH